MRHGKKIHKIGRGASHRKATLSALAIALIQHKHIQTTLAKARALRPYVEPLITKAKNDTTHARRTVFSVLQAKEAVHELFTEIGPKVADRPGGYTRILKLGPRPGDGAEMALIELVDYNEYLPSTLGTKKTTRRSRRGKKKTVGAESTPTVEAQTIETPAATEEPKPNTEQPEAKSETLETTVEAPAVAEVPAEDTPKVETESNVEDTPAAEVDTPTEEATTTEAPAGEDKKED